MIYEVQKFRSCDFGFELQFLVLDSRKFRLWFLDFGYVLAVSSLVLGHWIGLAPVFASVLGYWIGFSSGSWALDRFWLQFLVLDRFCFSSWVLDRLNIILLTNLIKEGAWIIPLMKKDFNSFIGRKEINVPRNGELIENQQKRRNVGSNVEKEYTRLDKNLVGGHANKDSPLKIIGSNETHLVSKQKTGSRDKRQVSEMLEDLEEEERKVVEIINKYRSNLDLKETHQMEGGTSSHVTPEHVVEVVKNFRESEKRKERQVTQEEMELYHRVNNICSSRLPEVKKSDDDEKVGQKRVCKDEMSREDVSECGSVNEGSISEGKDDGEKDAHKNFNAQLSKNEAKADASGSSKKKIATEKEIKKGMGWSNEQRNYYFC
ncbi:unnamed protein product [Rhizophagus irregularis]|nr:unnamed protein product [Rhizophagus irregularis]